MAISKSEASKLTQAELKRLASMEQTINNLLFQYEYNRGRCAVFFRDVAETITEREVVELIKRYQEANWKVEVRHSKRRGPFFAFS